MSMNGAFRSHLMQQFAASARSQSRPPLALACHVQVNRNETPSSSHATSSSSSPSTRPSRHNHDVSSSAAYGTPVNTQPTASSSSHQYQSLDNEDFEDGTLGLSETASVVQSSIRSRRTTSDFVPLDYGAPSSSATISSGTAESLSFLSPSSSSTGTRKSSQSNNNNNNNNKSNNLLSSHHIKLAINRAVRCAIEPSNHRRTAPTFFRRLTSPSSATDALANICYEVSLRHKFKKNKTKKNEEVSLEEAKLDAEKKRMRWKSVSSFVVALVGGQPDQTGKGQEKEEEEEEFDGGEYGELPLSPPKSIRQLEDYASACSSVQNLLLSLHSEGLGSKWATGPLTRTPAFRNLIRAKPDEAVVGLVMVGIPRKTSSKKGKKKKRRSGFVADVLMDV